jgi:hypothetical protein
MDIDSAIRAFAHAGHDLPRGAMRWALDHWDEAAPGLLQALERFVDGMDRSDEAAGAVFFILHLMGERRETRAFPLLCRLALDAEAVEAALGDGITTTYKGILINTYDGNLDTLKSVIEADTPDEFVRSGALEVLAYLTATGRIPRDEAEAYLRRLYETLQAEEGSFVWVGWTMAVGLLGLEALSDLVRQAFERGLIDPMFMDYDHFRKDLEQALAAPEDVERFEREGIKPLDDAIGELSGWYGFTEAAKREEERRDALDTISPLLWDETRPAVNPFRNVGRNDPCPCGSGKKFKKCCMPQ